MTADEASRKVGGGWRGGGGSARFSSCLPQAREGTSEERSRDRCFPIAIETKCEVCVYACVGL